MAVGVRGSRRGRAVVVGGSLGGLAAGISLREAGWEVEVFDRSRGELRGRGARIVVQPELLCFLEARGVPRGEAGVAAEAASSTSTAGAKSCAWNAAARS